MRDIVIEVKILDCVTSESKMISHEKMHNLTRIWVDMRHI